MYGVWLRVLIYVSLIIRYGLISCINCLMGIWPFSQFALILIYFDYVINILGK